MPPLPSRVGRGGCGRRLGPPPAVRRYHRPVPRYSARGPSFAARSSNYLERVARCLHPRLAHRIEVPVNPAAEQAEVLIYFGDDPQRLYQLTQWLPVMEHVAQTHRVACVLRSPATHIALASQTALPLALLPTFDDLMRFHERGRAKVVLYVNNGLRNFPSLVLRTALHVHVNHGESDKRSNSSNQAKAYDRVFVAGEVAPRRYLDTLLEFDERRLVTIGRPQLDFLPPAILPPVSRPTVMYAPTWEGESIDNDWSSLRALGVPIVEQLLLTAARVVYKPHPRVATSRDPGIASAHRTIMRLIGSPAADAGHLAFLEGNVLAAFESVDAL